MLKSTLENIVKEEIDKCIKRKYDSLTTEEKIEMVKRLDIQIKKPIGQDINNANIIIIGD